MEYIFKQERIAVSYETKAELQEIMNSFKIDNWKVANDKGFVSFFRKQMINEKTGSMFTTTFHVSPQKSSFKDYTMITAQEFFVLTGSNSILTHLNIKWSDTNSK